MEPTTVTRTYMTGDTLNKECMPKMKKKKKRKKKATFKDFMERHSA